MAGSCVEFRTVAGVTTLIPFHRFIFHNAVSAEQTLTFELGTEPPVTVNVECVTYYNADRLQAVSVRGGTLLFNLDKVAMIVARDSVHWTLGLVAAAGGVFHMNFLGTLSYARQLMGQCEAAHVE